MTRTPRDTFDIGGDLTVHRLGYGAMRLTGPRVLGDPDDPGGARDVLRRAVELGVDFVDTADSYGPGVSERLVGETLDPHPDGPVVATKGGYLRNADGDWIARGDPDYLHDAVLSSLDRLRRDRIDLYQLHVPDPDVPIEDSVAELAELRDRGRVRHLGISNVDVEEFDRAREVAEIATVQNEYNVANRDHEDVLEACAAAGVGFVPWYPLGGGDLEGKRGALEAIAGERGATPRQVALAWLLERSPVVLPIPGTASLAHLEENVAAAGLDLDDAAMARLEG